MESQRKEKYRTSCSKQQILESKKDRTKTEATIVTWSKKSVHTVQGVAVLYTAITSARWDTQEEEIQATVMFLSLPNRGLWVISSGSAEQRSFLPYFPDEDAGSNPA